jgi:hypothetical protein
MILFLSQQQLATDMPITPSLPHDSKSQAWRRLSGPERARRVAVKMVNERDPEHRRLMATMTWWNKRNAKMSDQRAAGWAYIQSLRNPLQ